MSRLVRIGLMIGLIALLFLPATLGASAQAGWDIRVTQVSTLETPDRMVLKVYFNVYEPKTGAPVLNAVPSSAQITLLNTNYVSQGQVKKPDVPIYITMVMDSSGSMGLAAPALRQAAKLALSNTPDNSFFSVIQFDESIKLLQDFTQNISAVTFAIDQYKVNPKGTCLYDAAYTAAETLSKAPTGRRAVILFTDGKDETVNGTPCSKHNFQDLTTFANSVQVPINTIGLSDVAANINAAELQNMATSTGGFSAIGGQADLSASFGKIMDALKAQWMVQADIYPIQGDNKATVNVTLQDNTTLAKDVSFKSNTNYPGPPSPVSAQFAGLLFHPQNSTYDIQLNLTSPELVSYIKVSIWDKKNGSKVAEYEFKDPVASNTFNIPTDQLIVGGDYEMHLIAVSKSDNTPFNLSTDQQGKASAELLHEFTYDPTALSPKIEIQSVAQQANDIAVTVTTNNIDLIGGFDGWLIDETTNTRVQNSNFKLPPMGAASGTLVIPAGKSKIPDGKYTVVVEVLGQNNQVYSSMQYPGVVYKATRPSLIQTLWVALVAAPIIFGVVVAILLGVVGYFMYTSMRSKSMTGTPVLQGRMGGKLPKGPSGGQVLPLADNEPIPMHGQSQATGSNPVPPAIPQAPSQPIPAQPAAANREDQTRFAGVEAGSTLIAARQGAGAASLTVVRSPEDVSAQGRQVALTQFPFMIGRVEGNLHIQDASISRRHAQITYDGASQTYFITDVNSSNGTRLNGQLLAPGQPFQLIRGAEIGLGPNVTLRFDLG